MIDKSYLSDLLAILKLHGVASIKMQGLELVFHVEHQSLPQAFLSPEIASDSFSNITETLKKQEEALPADLRADNLMDVDKILNWSSPDQNPDEPPLPLIGEEPL